MNIKRIFTSLICCGLLLSSYCTSVFAAQNIPEVNSNIDNSSICEIVEADDEITEVQAATPRSSTLANFSGVYYGWLDVPFTVTDSSKTVKVLFSARALNDSEMATYTGIKKSNGSLWFWTKNNQTGNSHIYTVGKMKTGDYILRIKTNQNASGYSISGQVYYYN